MPRTAARGRLVSSVVALAMLGTLVAAVYDRSAGSPEARLAATAGCADVLLVLVPGNGEGAGTTPVSAGRTVGRVRDVYLREAKASGRTVETRVVPYRTRGLAVLRPSNPTLAANRSITAAHARSWGHDMNWARDYTVSLLAQRAAACPHQSIVLAGYGQGAGVLHRVLRRLGTNATSKRVIGAILVSDPDRERWPRAVRWGSPAAAGGRPGIMEGTRAYFNGPVPVPGSYPRVLSVCRTYDVVCDYSAVRASTGLALAGSYYDYNRAQLDAAAVDLATRSRAIPDPRPEVTEVAGKPGVPLRVQVGVDVLSHYRAGLRWSHASALPPGMWMTNTGVFIGTPRTAGTWTFHYTVRNPAAAAFNRPVPGRVVLRVSAATPTPTPTATPPPPQTDAFTSAGGDTSCTVRDNGTLWCWGDNYEGQVGIGSRDNQTTPRRVGASSAWRTVNTGGTHTCGVLANNALWCWGRNDYGQVGDGSRTRRLAPVRVTARLYAAVATSTHHTCAVAIDSTLWCWGLNDKGQLGVRDRSTRLTPTQVTTMDGWVSVSTGAWHTCATRTDRSVLCWGANSFGQLGHGDTVQRLAPVRIGGPGNGLGYRMVSAGDTHSCAVTTAGQVRCWGANTTGQVGDGTATLRTLPVAVADGTSYASVDAGLMTSCGVTTARQVRCWGAGWTGLLGAGGVNTSLTPRAVASTTDFARVEVGWGHTCALATTGGTWCWGLSSAGQIGRGNHVTVRTPVQVTA